MQNYYKMGIANKKYTDFLITYCYEKLAEVMEEVPKNGWNSIQLFK